MLGRRSAQDDLFAADNQYLSFVGRDSFYGYLAAHRHELFRDEDFASLYCLDNGRESVPPSLLACALLLQWYDNVSDQEAVDRSKFDLRWKVALGLQMDDEPFAKGTLWLFRTQLIVHKHVRTFLEASLKHARAQGYFKSRKVTSALDTTPIIGKGAVEDTYNLLAESLRQVLRVLARLEDTTLAHYASQHDFRRYTEPSFKGTVSIDWDNESERQVVLQALVADCDRVLALARKVLARSTPESNEAKQILEATELLSKILAQDVRRTDAGTSEIIDGVAPDRMVSVHDPEMRHGRKSVSQRFDGYKASVAVDTESQLVTGVDVLAANEHDATDAEGLLQQTEQNTESRVETIIGDSAYGSVEQRLAATEHERTLIAPVPKAPATGRFTKEEFQIDLAHDTVTCPAGKSTSLWYQQKRRTKRGKTFHSKAFRFAPEQCQGCPMRGRCVKPGAQWRSVSVHEHEVLIQAAKQFQRTEQFRQLYRQRVTVEHRIARLVQLGLRKARFFGKAKVLFQLAMTAAVANFTLMASRANNALSFMYSLLQTLAVCFSVRWRALFIVSRLMSVRRAVLCSSELSTYDDTTKTRGFRLCL
jgi:IS5 family transposase